MYVAVILVRMKVFLSWEIANSYAIVTTCMRLCIYIQANFDGDGMSSKGLLLLYIHVLWGYSIVCQSSVGVMLNVRHYLVFYTDVSL